MTPQTKTPPLRWGLRASDWGARLLRSVSLAATRRSESYPSFVPRRNSHAESERWRISSRAGTRSPRRTVPGNVPPPTTRTHSVGMQVPMSWPLVLPHGEKAEICPEKNMEPYRCVNCGVNFWRETKDLLRCRTCQARLLELMEKHRKRKK